MKILLVEDDQRAATTLERSLREQGFFVDVAPDGVKGLALGNSSSYDCLILDVMLPGMDGFSLLWELRAAGVETPVMFLTARDSLEDKVRGLELGGGDYLVKPFAFSELLLRINNLLARGSATGPKTWVIGDLTVNPFQRKVYRGGDRIELSSQEYALLALLIRNVGHIVTRMRIADELWEISFQGDPNLVDAAVRRLRKKLDDPYPQKIIQTRRGVGYLIEPGRD